MEILSASSLRLPRLGIQNKIASIKTTNNSTPPIDIPTTLLVVKNFFDFPELVVSCADGPSACFPGVFGGVFPVGGPQKGSVGGAGPGGVNGDVGGETGAIEELNRFPSFLH